MILERLAGLTGSASVAWHKGRIDAYYRQQEWQVKRGLAAELAKMRSCRQAIDELKKEAAEMISAAPWAKDDIAALLRQRLLAIRGVAAGDIRAAVSGEGLEA